MLTLWMHDGSPMVSYLIKRPDRSIVNILISLLMRYSYQNPYIGKPKNHDLVSKVKNTNFRRVAFVPQST